MSPEISIRETSDDGMRLIGYYRDDLPIVGLEITPDGTITVGHWLTDGTWKRLLMSAPGEKETD